MKLTELCEGRVGEKKNYYCSKCARTTPHAGQGGVLWSCSACGLRKVDVGWAQTQFAARPTEKPAEIVGKATEPVA